MNGITMMIIAIVVLGGAYLLYGRYLQNKWGIDPKAKTPAYEMEDGVDYVPADTNVVFGHQFASIAGAGPINGPIQAAIFGWLPVLLWILIGGVFFGAVQDFASMYASVKNKGRTIGYIIEAYIGKLGKKLFLLFCWLFCILVVAAFADVVAGTFNGFAVNDAGTVTKVAANGAVATTSMLFIFEAVALGFFLKYTKFNKWVNTAVAILLLVAAIVLGLNFPMYVSLGTWHIIIFVYILIASVAPVWALLQPRDYLNSYLLIFMIVGAVIGVFVANPSCNLKAFTSFNVDGQYMFPILFVTIACGAVSGFHCMISTGTTPKMLMNERSILPVGYGAMLTESFVGMMALIAACSLVPNDYFAINSSAEHFQALGIQVVDLPQLNAMVGENVAHRPGGAVSLAVGMAFIFSNIPGLDHLMNYWYHFCIMFEALFIMTIIDAGTRVGRYMLQELIGRVWPKFGDPHWLPGAIIASALISGAWGYIVLQGNLSTIWPIFGVSNQLLAIITLAISTVVICSMGKARFAWVTIIPWAFLTVVIFWADYLNMFNIYLPKQEWLLFIVSAIMALLVIIVSISSIRRCLYLAKTVPPSYDTTETVEAEELKHLEELIKTDPVAKRFKELTVDHH